MKAQKLRVYPSKAQIIILKQWFGASRFIYNKVLEYITNSQHPKRFNIKHLRSLFINNENYKYTNNWMLDVPYDVRDEALRTLLKNYNSNFKKKSNNGFEIKYKKKKALHDSISVLKKYWNHKTNKSAFYRAYNNWKIENVGKINLNHDSKLKKNILGQYFLCIPSHCDSNKLCLENQERNEIASIDPGLRTLLTVYDPQGYIHEIAKTDISYIARLLHYLNKLRSRYKNRRYRRAYYKLLFRIKNLIDNFYKTVSVFLLSRYKTIVIPKLNFHMFTNLKRKQKMLLQTVGHCNFVDYLKMKARSYNSKIIVVDESYTSKTCTKCGTLNGTLKSSKIFKCKECKLIIDRDINGARNILLKSL